MKKGRTLTEALDLIQELDYVPGVSMSVPDFNYTISRRNFDTVERGGEFPYDDDEQGPWNSVGKGQAGIGRGGVGLGGRPDVSGGVREPSSRYTSTWNEGADFDELQRHGRGRNLWRDTVTGKKVRDAVENEEEIEEAIGVPSNIAMAYGHGSNMMGQTIPGSSGGWARSPNLGDEREDDDMRLREMFDASPIQFEELENPAQDNFGDSTDDELEDKVGHEEPEQGDEMDMFAEPDGEEEMDDMGGEEEEATLVITPHDDGMDFVPEPALPMPAPGALGAPQKGSNMLDKGSAWDVLAKVVNAMAPDEEENCCAPVQNLAAKDEPGIAG